MIQPNKRRSFYGLERFVGLGRALIVQNDKRIQILVLNTEESDKSKFHALVVKVIDEFTLVINKGNVTLLRLTIDS